MILKKENLWQNPGYPGMIIVTTNGYITRGGYLTMGRGAALEAKNRIKGIEYECAKILTMNAEFDAMSKTYEYGFMPIRPQYNDDKKIGFGIFQVKHHWNHKANLDLIERSADSLTKMAKMYPDVSFRMNYPGIGNGKLSTSDVQPILTRIPDNVTICYK